MKQFITALAICAVLAAVGTALAAAGTANQGTHYWTDGDRGDSYWSTGPNWSPTAVPDTGDNAVFNSNHNYAVLTVDDEITNLDMSTASGVGIDLYGNTLVVTGTWTVGDNGSPAESYVEITNTDAGDAILQCGLFDIEQPAAADPQKTTTLFINATDGSITIVVG